MNVLLMTVKALGHLVGQRQRLQHHDRSYAYEQQVLRSNIVEHPAMVRASMTGTNFKHIV